MEQRHLGRTGLRVSRIGLGTLTWGRDTDEHDAADQLKAFWDAGGTLVDTADVYGGGEAEYVLGQLMERLVPRRDLVISTKAGSVPDPDRRMDGSRGHLLAALDASWPASAPTTWICGSSTPSIRTPRSRSPSRRWTSR